MSSVTQTAAKLDDLYRVKSKAELIAGRIIHLMATGYKPSRVAFQIVRSLDDYANATGRGEAFTDNTGYAVPVLSSGRESFSPDASYFVGPFPVNEMRFLEGPPTLAVEVRSENDYGDSAEVSMGAKRPTISRPARRSSGTWIPLTRSSGSIERTCRTSRSCSPAAKKPMPNLRCWAGG